VLGIREPTFERVGYGHTSKEVDVRRFLTGGYLDTWVLPRDVLRATDPNGSLLAIIEHVENVTGPKPKAVR
jgi:hypothetical protein